ncbi:hypothetical protein [Ralstonia soli]|uniref:Uncharacterized protein n=1 Tax=Ralstonia soli TaxID=2953896 RepID=A0ABT1AKE6_9RALS|nr:hypothetical protein [Ralstonia soli]MCO5398858.1 hypothetical protein [Ralstonia soli]
MRRTLVMTLLFAAVTAAASAYAESQPGAAQNSVAERADKIDPYTDGAAQAKRDPYTEGARRGKFDPYTEGAKGKRDAYTDGGSQDKGKARTADDQSK